MFCFNGFNELFQINVSPSITNHFSHTLQSLLHWLYCHVSTAVHITDTHVGKLGWGRGQGKWSWGWQWEWHWRWQWLPPKWWRGFTQCSHHLGVLCWVMDFGLSFILSFKIMNINLRSGIYTLPKKMCRRVSLSICLSVGFHLFYSSLGHLALSP